MSRVGPSRRCLLASLAFLSLSGYLLAGLEPGVGCPNDNPFIVIMKKDGVQLYDTPKRVSSVCKHEFETYGTCCKESKLVGYAKKDTKQVIKTHDKLIAEFKKLVKANSKLVTDIGQIASLKEAVSSESGRSEINSAIFTAQQIESSHEFIELQKLFGNTTTAHIEEFARENLNCWTRLAKERNVSICATCSGRSNHFFEDGKILITEHLCSELTEICEAPMKTITELVAGISHLKKISEHIADAGIQIKSGKANGLGGILGAILGGVFAGVENMNQFLQAAPAPISRRIHSEAMHQIALCGKFVKMREPIMLQDMEKILDKISGMKFDIKPSLKTYIRVHRNRQRTGRYQGGVSANYQRPTGTAVAPTLHSLFSTNQPNRWRIGGRVLQFGGTPTPNLGTDAQVVDPTDPSYSGVGVSGHVPVAEGSEF